MPVDVASIVGIARPFFTCLFTSYYRDGDPRMYTLHFIITDDYH